MEVRAVAKYIKVQPRKVRIIADEVRGQSAAYTSSVLRYHPSKGARVLRKVLESAMANAAENHNIDRDALRIATIMVDEGPRMKRMQARAMGRGNRIVKKTSHITVVVEEYDAQPAAKGQATKAKPRPTFAAPNKKGGKKKAADQPKAAAPVETTDTTAEEVSAAPAIENEGANATPEEATPVAASEAPEEGTSAEEQNETTAQAEGAEEEKGA